jgi:predicted ATPase
MGSVLASLASGGNRRIRGLYLHGPVGRGKTQLLNLFMDHVGIVTARRIHMHAFMMELHERLFEIKAGDPVIQIARSLANECRVLGFDEFYVSNIADGMLLGRLFQHLFQHGVVIVATSNWPMDQLYPDGRNRESLLPFIRILENNLQAIDLGDGQDYRQAAEGEWPLYLVALSGHRRPPNWPGSSRNTPALKGQTRLPLPDQSRLRADVAGTGSRTSASSPWAVRSTWSSCAASTRW